MSKILFEMKIGFLNEFFIFHHKKVKLSTSMQSLFISLADKNSNRLQRSSFLSCKIVFLKQGFSFSHPCSLAKHIPLPLKCETRVDFNPQLRSKVSEKIASTSS
jgi:hypothetical protein